MGHGSSWEEAMKGNPAYKLSEPNKMPITLEDMEADPRHFHSKGLALFNGIVADCVWAC